MNQTTNFGLNQWNSTDRIQMEDFNADNAKIDAALAGAGNCKIVTGSYMGTGAAGVNNPNTLTFSERPVLLIVSGTYTMVVPGLIPNGRSLPTDCGYDTFNYFSWQDNTLNWYNSAEKEYCQLNTEDETYHYVAFFAK